MPASFGVPADRCKGCGQDAWLDLLGHCSNCALDRDGDHSPILPKPAPVSEEEWQRALALVQ